MYHDYIPMGMGARRVVVSGNYAYLTSYSNGLRIVNVADLGSPTEAGLYTTLGSGDGVAVVGGYVYVAGHASGLRIINVTDPPNPIETGFYDTPEYALDAAVVGEYAYVADYGSGLHIINVSNVVQPYEVSDYQVPGMVYSVAVSGTYAYVGWGKLSIVDVSKPAYPQEVSTYDALALDVAVAGDYVYVAGYYGLHIIDISDPAHPHEVGFYDTPGYAFGIAVAGNYAYVADYDRGLRIISVADPANPVEVGFYDTLGYARDVAVAGNYAYVADENSLSVFYVADPANPIRVGFYNTLGAASDVAVAGDYVYIADGVGGLLILRFSSPVSTFIVPTGGGNFISEADHTTYFFPAGVFTDTVVLTHIPLYPEDSLPVGSLAGINHFFEVNAVYSSTGQIVQLSPSQVYTLTVQYTEAERGPAIEETLALYRWDGSQWVKETSAIDTESNIVMAEPAYFSTWAVLGETHRVYLPWVFQFRCH
jgi:hypothetical protein